MGVAVLFFLFFPPVPCFTTFSCLLHFLWWDHEQAWRSLRLYPLKTKTPVPLPLYVTLFSLSKKVRTLTPLSPSPAFVALLIWCPDCPDGGAAAVNGLNMQPVLKERETLDFLNHYLTLSLIICMW